MAEPSVFVPYRIICGYSELRHPSDIVETKSLASISMQKPTYKHHLPLPLLDKDQEFPPLSGVQLDAVLLAGEAHSKMLESSEKGGKPSRRAFLIGRKNFLKSIEFLTVNPSFKLCVVYL